MNSKLLKVYVGGEAKKFLKSEIQDLHLMGLINKTSRNDEIVYESFFSHEHLIKRLDDYEARLAKQGVKGYV